jgi:hypothetical protein
MDGPIECRYCERVLWGAYKYLGRDEMGIRLYRHEECVPGSRSWTEWYDRHPHRHTSAGDILRKYVKTG